MASVVRKVVSLASYWLGVYSLCRRVNAKKKVTCVFYHDIADEPPLTGSSLFVQRDFFWQHIHELKSNYSVIAMSDLLSGGRLPPYPLTITFDGYSHRYLELAKELSNRKIKALFYLQTEPISTGRPHWRQQLAFLFQNLRNVRVSIELDNELFSRDLGDKPSQVSRAGRELARRLEPLEGKHEMVRRIAQGHQVDLDDFDAKYRPLTPEEVAQLTTIPGIEVGSHSHTHSAPDGLDRKKALQELRTSKQLLEMWAKKQVLHYAYPFGIANEAAAELLEQTGYLTAATAEAKLHEPYSSSEWPYRIPRFGVSNDPFYLLAGRLDGSDKMVDTLINHCRKMLSGRKSTKVLSVR